MRRPAPRPNAPRRACRATVSASGRVSSPASNAAVGSIDSIPRYSGSCSHSGSSIHSPTSLAARKSPSTQTSSASEPATVGARLEQRSPGRRAIDRVVGAGQLVLCRRARSTPPDRARRSPGRPPRAAQARAPAPPSAIRCGQYVKRPVGSHGPTIRPGRGMNAPREARAHDVLAVGLQLAVGLAPLLGRLCELANGDASVGGVETIGVDRDGRDERVVADVGRARRACARRCAARSRSCRRPRRTSRPSSADEVAVPVAAQLLDVRGRARAASGRG